MYLLAWVVLWILHCCLPLCAQMYKPGTAPFPAAPLPPWFMEILWVRLNLFVSLISASAFKSFYRAKVRFSSVTVMLLMLVSGKINGNWRIRFTNCSSLKIFNEYTNLVCMALENVWWIKRLCRRLGTALLTILFVPGNIAPLYQVKLRLDSCSSGKDEYGWWKKTLFRVKR